MKKFTQIMITVMGLVTMSTLAVFGDGGNQLQNQVGGNQLSQGALHWYQQPADKAGGVPGVSAKSGSLLALQTGSSLYMEGDSTLHKYQMRAGVLQGSALLPKGGDLLAALKAGKVESMSLAIPLSDFKSRESGLDSNADKALKADANPQITFTLVKESLKTGSDAGAYAMTAEGTLTVAGETAPVTLHAEATVKDGKVALKGVQKLKMSDFKVAPPSISLLVTSITCTDEIQIYYDVVFAPLGEAGSVAEK